MSDYLETVEIETGSNPRSAIIWLHGLGADGHDFEPIVPELKLPVATRFVFPHAPVRPVTINNGAVMRAWYDILSFDRNGPSDEAGIRASAAQVDALIQREIGRGCDPGHVVVAGFSQGGAIALHCGLRYPQKLGGVMVLSAYLPLSDKLSAEASTTNRDTPIFFAHGNLDPVLPLGMGETSRDFLLGQGYQVEWNSYPMAHGICPQEIDDINQWLLNLPGKL